MVIQLYDVCVCEANNYFAEVLVLKEFPFGPLLIEAMINKM